MKKLLPLYVYRWGLGNCTNGGISGTEDKIYVRHPQGWMTEDNVDPSLIFEEEQRGPDYWALVPILRPAGKLGPMHGGNLAHSSDSRCKRVYRIHDRFETQEQYDALSV